MFVSFVTTTLRQNSRCGAARLLSTASATPCRGQLGRNDLGTSICDTEPVSTRLKLAAWALFAVVVVLNLVAAYYSIVTRSYHDSSSWGNSGLVSTLGLGLTTFMFPLVGVVIALRRPANAIGWLMLAIGFVWGLEGVLSGYATDVISFNHGSREIAGYAAAVDGTLWLPGVGLIGTFLILLFPDGHLPSPRWRWVGWLAGLTIALGSAVILFSPGPMTDSSYPTLVNPLGVGAVGTLLDVAHLVIILLPLAILGAAASMVSRYRASYGADRLQLKWLAASATLVAVLYGVTEVLSVTLGSNNRVPEWLLLMQDLALLSFALIPISIGFAVFRYRLYEIDVIIRRTLVYSTLIGSLAVVYLGGVYLLGDALQRLTGQSGALAVTVSTLAVAAAFQPLRSRIQLAVDHRFYRTKYDASLTLDAFSGRLRQQIDLDALQAEVLAVVTDTLGPSQATLWFRSDR